MAVALAEQVDAAIVATENQEPAIRRRPGRPKSANPKPPKKVKEVKIGTDGKPVLPEAQEQQIVVVYCDRLEIPFFAVNNGARRTMWEAIQAKRMGMKAGVLDLVFPVPRHGYGGLIIEMKRREGGIVSPIQKYWIALFRENNFRVEVAEGADPAIAIIDEYFKGWGGLSNDLKLMLQAIHFAKGDGK